MVDTREIDSPKHQANLRAVCAYEGCSATATDCDHDGDDADAGPVAGERLSDRVSQAGRATDDDCGGA